MFLLTRYEVRGRENVPSEGPLVVVANHLNLADPPLLGISISRQTVFMAKKQLFRLGCVGYFIRSFGAFPVSRGRLDRKALRQANQVLADGLALVIFPEGMRSRSGKLRAAFQGPALLAIHNGTPILPVGIIGTEKIKGFSWILHRPRVIVNIGCPFHLSSASSRLTKAKRAELTNFIMQRIAELLPLEYRGDYAEEGDC